MVTTTYCSLIRKAGVHAKTHTSFPVLSNVLFNLIYCVFDVCGHACLGQHVEVRGQPTGLSSLSAMWILEIKLRPGSQQPHPVTHALAYLHLLCYQLKLKHTKPKACYS